MQDLQCSFQIYTSGFTGKYRCRIYNAVSRSTLQVSQGLAGIIRGSETTLQIAKSFTSIYRIEQTESKQGKKSSNRKIKIKRQEKNKDKGARSSRNEDQNQEDMQDEKEDEEKEDEEKDILYFTFVFPFCRSFGESLCCNFHAALDFLLQV